VQVGLGASRRGEDIPALLELTEGGVPGG